MRILLTGASGQLGQAFIAAKPKQVELIATTRHEIDLNNLMACKNIVEELRPDWVVNCAAYTAVDKAETERELAMAINAYAPEAFAEALLKTGGKLLQLSTDYVFNGNRNMPYETEEDPSPLGVYGESKAAGEAAVQKLLQRTNQVVVLRTSWLIGPVGKNFALTMLQLHRNKNELKVVADQIGCPTSTLTLSSTCWKIINFSNQTNSDKEQLPMIMHWSDSGVASWYDIAVAIGEIGKELGLINQPAKVYPIGTKDYPTQAKRPVYSILNCRKTREILDLPATHWRDSLKGIMSTTNT